MEVTTKYATTLKVLRTDNALEFTQNATHKFCTRKGILHQATCPYTSQQNGVVITCIFNLNSYLILLIFILILCDYDACYHIFYEFSPLICHFTKVHIYA